MARALSTSDGTPPPPMATRILPSRAAKKRPAESGSDAEDLPKPPPKKAATAKKAAAKKGTAKKDTTKDVKGKEKAPETEKKEKKPTKGKGKGKQKVDAVVDDADEEPVAPKATRRKTTKAAQASKTTTTRATKRAAPEEDSTPLASTSNAALPGTPPRKRQRLMEGQAVRRSPRRPTASANKALAGNSHAAEPTRESGRGRAQSIGQRRERAPELAPLILPTLLGPGPLSPSSPSPEPENRETTPHDATPPASPRETSRPPSLATLGLLSQLHNPIIPYSELDRRSPTPDAEARSPSPAPTEIVHHFQPAKERPLDEINEQLARAGIKVRDFAWEGVYHEEWKVRVEEVNLRRQRDLALMEAPTEEWDKDEVQASQPARRIGPPPSQNQQAGPSTQPLNRVGTAATFPPQPASQPAETQTQESSPARPPHSQPAPNRALVRASRAPRALGRTGTMQSFYGGPSTAVAGPSNAVAGPSNAVAGPSNTARAMTPVRERTPVADEDAPRAATPVAEPSNATPVATPQTTPAAATQTAHSRPTTPSPAATRTRRTRTSNEGARRVSGEHSSLPRTASSLSLVSVL
ncbi:unnamed protein product [Peniophora sp. CBMAI 1063]|nr:unnamed protein product [Peniophora sp. CBMAI 1063]